MAIVKMLCGSLALFVGSVVLRTLLLCFKNPKPGCSQFNVMKGNSEGKCATMSQKSNAVLQCSLNQGLFFPCKFPENPNCGIAQLLEILNLAESSLHVCVMSISYGPLIKLLTTKQMKRIDVRVYTSHTTSHNGSAARRFRAVGIPVRSRYTKYATEMHNKFVIMDGIAVATGSLNWTKDGVRNNTENVIVTTDKRIVPKFALEFSKLWENFDEEEQFDRKLRQRQTLKEARESQLHAAWP